MSHKKDARLIWVKEKHININYDSLNFQLKQVGEYEQEIPQSHTSKQPIAPLGRVIEKTSERQSSLSVTSNVNCVVARCLIYVVYLTACAFIRS